ncbi:MAG: TIM barrel protein [Methanobrevibacter sp.]|jgi:deoxyribonuclease-4|nr:TIM barrel protein [Candidatus Methanovirga basalitermitum]
MKPKIIFGPAGRPINYKGPAYKAPEYIANEKLSAYEYQAGRGLRISEKSSNILKEESNKHDVLISMHAPYFINLSSNNEKTINNSIDILFKSAQIGDWMGVYRIVFHPGHYLKNKKNETLKIAKSTINKVLEKIEKTKIKNFTFSPETTGKKSQLGNLNEIIAICKEFDNFEPTIDIAHLYARDNGSIQSKNDYNKIFSNLENELDIKRLHYHFTRIEYGKSGEIRHHVLSEVDYGPNPKYFIESLIECDFKATVICESPLLDHDALILKKLYESLL